MKENKKLRWATLQASKKYKPTKISKDLLKNITGFLKRDYFETTTASKAVTCTSQKASTSDQRDIAVTHHFPEGKKRQITCLRSQESKFASPDFPFLAERQSVGVCTPCTCLPTSSLPAHLQIYNRRITICQPSSVKLEKQLERMCQK